jgi:hypothetical protein
MIADSEDQERRKPGTRRLLGRAREMLVITIESQEAPDTFDLVVVD